MKFDAFSPQDCDSLAAAASLAAGSYGRSYRGYVTREDLYQECWVWAYDHPAKAREYLLHEDPQQGARLLHRSMGNHLTKYCQAEKAHQLGYEVEDLYYWSKAALSDVLPHVWDYDAWVDPGVPDTGRTTRRDPAEGNNWVASLADVSRGLDLIPEGQRELLRGRFAEGLDVDALAYRHETTVEAMEKRIERAVGKLQRVLGGGRPYGDPRENVA